MADSLQSVKQRFGIIGRSPALDHALSTAVRVAPTDLTVLITGESGVGKENFSKIIHSLSARKHNKFIAINCGAIPEGTINSELFGHEKGAFTGATSDRRGYFETVDGGTIFLDEIGEMPLDTQTFLLRVLESGEFIRVGSSKISKTDVRIIAATNVDLIERVKKGKFREDLYYRLSTVPIQVPALRERGEDIYLLFRKFAVDFAEKYRTSPIQLAPEARTLLLNYQWPGNIRELKNIAEQVSVLSTEREIQAADLFRFVPDDRSKRLPVLASSQNGQEQFQEREILYKLLFDMKNDLNDLKSLVFELISTNNLRVPDLQRLQAIKALNPGSSDSEANFEASSPSPSSFSPPVDHSATPIIVDNPNFQNVDVLEDSLSLADMERELIQRALKKHKGKRKDAAAELEISERTLYRKIKHYNIKE
ncbi:MAG: sigma-54 dependent transcriptional regulator [Bacteroidota bacterium]